MGEKQLVCDFSAADEFRVLDDARRPSVARDEEKKMRKERKKKEEKRKRERKHETRDASHPRHEQERWR